MAEPGSSVRVEGAPGDPDLTWPCRVCGEERPDALIGVHKRVVVNDDPTALMVEPHGVELVITLCYCADRDKCALGVFLVAQRVLLAAGGR